MSKELHLCFGTQSIEKVLAQISRLAEIKIAAEVDETPSRSCESSSLSSSSPASKNNAGEEIRQATIDELKQSIIDQKTVQLSGIDQSILDQLCDQTDVRFEASPEFIVYLRLHLILYGASRTYREILAKVRAQSKEMCPSLAPNTPIGILPKTDFEFEACWSPTNHYVCITTIIASFTSKTIVRKSMLNSSTAPPKKKWLFNSNWLDENN